MDCNDYFSARRQGDILSSLALGSEAPADYVVVSQSCDVVLPKRENVLLARLVELAEGEAKRGALNRENPRYVQVPLDGSRRFADLNSISSYKKESVSGAEATPGVDPAIDSEVRDFSLAIGRWFSRFAFPNDVQPWLEPLQKQIRDKYVKPNAPVGKILQRVVEIRVEADSWTSRPCTLTIHLIVGVPWMPILEDDEDKIARGSKPATNLSDLTSLADQMLKNTDPVREVALWGAFAWALADKCTPRQKFSDDESVNGAVLEVEAEVWTDEEFPLSRVRKSEQLDVDFLSDPTPL